MTVLRDGQLIATVDAEALTSDSAAQMMVGRELANLYPPKNEPDVDAPLVLSVENLNAKGIKDISFDLRKGEILGFAGLIGSGRTAVAEAVVGLMHRTFGHDRDQRQAGAFHQCRAVGRGRARLYDQGPQGQGPSDQYGADAQPHPFDPRPPSQGRASSTRPARRGRSSAPSAASTSAPATPRCSAGQLSGGNQQKLMLGKTMESEPEIIIMDEPTRGIDVGTKQQIYHIIAALAAEGKSIILISSELQEVIGLSHRVMVMRNGRITGELERRRHQ